MFDPNDIFISLVGTSRLVQLGINLDLYSNFSFREKIHINVVYNGENLREAATLTKLLALSPAFIEAELEDQYDSLHVLSENRGYCAGLLDGINASLKNFIESDRNIGVIHNFDYLFFYDSSFERLINDFINANKSILMWKMKNADPIERAIFQTDCFVITKEFATQIYPINPKDDTTIFYRKVLAKDSGGDVNVMEEWFFQKLVNIIMPEDLVELNNYSYSPELSEQHIEKVRLIVKIKRDHNMIMDRLHKYGFFIATEVMDITKEVEKDGSAEIFTTRDGIDDVNKGVYDSKYHSIHTHHHEILRPLLIMFKYNLDNKKFKTIDKFINNEISLMD